MIEQIMNFFIPTAYADPIAATNAQNGSGFSFFFIVAIFFFFIYFMILRPQNKRAKEQQTLLSALAKGDEVVLAGGILGRIVKISDQYLTLTLANNIDILVQKSAVVTVLPKGTLKSLE